MKRKFALLLSCLALAAAAEEAAPARAPRAVYLLPMRSGLDQFLANHLSSMPDFQVVIDPKMADIIMTDRLGPGFEQRLKELFPPAPEATPEPAPQPQEADKDASGQEGESNVPPQALVKAPPAGSGSTFSRGKGNVFLVDLASRQVVWSTFERPEGSLSEDLERAAGHIAGKLRKDLKANPLKAPSKRPPEAQPAPAPPPVK